jgi:hypothetical protein
MSKRHSITLYDIHQRQMQLEKECRILVDLIKIYNSYTLRVSRKGEGSILEVAAGTKAEAYLILDTLYHFITTIGG